MFGVPLSNSISQAKSRQVRGEEEAGGLDKASLRLTARWVGGRHAYNVVLYERLEAHVLWRASERHRLSVGAVHEEVGLLRGVNFKLIYFCFFGDLIFFLKVFV